MTLMSTVPEPTILKRDVPGRVTTPLVQKEALLDEFERSSAHRVSVICGRHHFAFGKVPWRFRCFRASMRFTVSWALRLGGELFAKGS
jgi:hypothetical protein